VHVVKVMDLVFMAHMYREGQKSWLFFKFVTYGDIEEHLCMCVVP